MPRIISVVCVALQGSSFAQFCSLPVEIPELCSLPNRDLRELVKDPVVELSPVGFTDRGVPFSESLPESAAEGFLALGMGGPAHVPGGIHVPGGGLSACEPIPRGGLGAASELPPAGAARGRAAATREGSPAQVPGGVHVPGGGLSAREPDPRGEREPAGEPGTCPMRRSPQRRVLQAELCVELPGVLLCETSVLLEQNRAQLAQHGLCQWQARRCTNRGGQRGCETMRP